MPDTAKAFIKSIMDGDDKFIQGLTSTTIWSVFAPPPFPPPPQLDSDPFLDYLKAYTHRLYTEAKKVVDEHPKCIESEDVWVIKDYVTKSEIPFVLDTLEHTFVKEYVHIPPGVEAERKRLDAIPCCKVLQ